MADVAGMVLEVVMCLGALCFAGFVLWYVFGQERRLFAELRLRRRSRGWVETEGWVRSSKVVVKQGSRHRYYEVQVLYEYEVGGQTIRGERRRFGPDFRESREEAEGMVVGKYAKKTKVRVYYDTQQVRESVLERRCKGVFDELWMDWLLFLVGVFFATVGVVGMVGIFTGKGR